MNEIVVNKETFKLLNKIKKSNENYNDLLNRMCKFLDQAHLDIQQQKMKELWDNEEDEAWENA